MTTTTNDSVDSSNADPEMPTTSASTGEEKIETQEEEADGASAEQKNESRDSTDEQAESSASDPSSDEAKKPTADSSAIGNGYDGDLEAGNLGTEEQEDTKPDIDNTAEDDEGSPDDTVEKVAEGEEKRAEESTEEQQNENAEAVTEEATKKRKKLLICGGIFVVLAIAIGLGVGLPLSGLTSATDDQNPSFHAPLILVDPSTLDPSITGSLMVTLLADYDRNGMDSTPLDPSSGDNTPQRRAFFWLAQENNQELDHTTKMTRYALAVLYYSTNQVRTAFEEQPETWYSAEKWLTKASYCEWHGISCNAQSRVEAINLDHNVLSGSLPIELAIMRDTLRVTDVTSNSIAMTDTDFDAFINLVNLEELFADDNYFEHNEGLPLQMAGLVNLKLLSMSYNLLGGNLTSNPVIPVMTHLTHMELEANYFTGSIPTYIGAMTGLETLNMRRNDFQGDLSFLNEGGMKSLFLLWLDQNGISGTIPSQIGALQELASLGISNTNIKGPIPKEMGNLLKLRRAWLDGNQLSGEIPQSLGNLDNLEILELHLNNLSGSMPQGICNTFATVDSEFMALTADCKGQVSCSCCTKCY